jgi:uncharacterized delta-60 repeat protein
MEAGREGTTAGGARVRRARRGAAITALLWLPLALAACRETETRPDIHCDPTYYAQHWRYWPIGAVSAGQLALEPIRVAAMECYVDANYHIESRYCSRATLSRGALLTLHDARGLPVAGSSVASADNETRFLPVAPLRPGETYTVTASGGRTGCGLVLDATWTVTPWQPPGVDATFGVGGDQFLADLVPLELAVQPDGAVLVSGQPPGTSAASLTRLDATGLPDAAFGPAGQRPCPTPAAGPNPCGSYGFSAIAVDPAGRILGAGALPFRLDAAGALDPTFGSGGVLTAAASLDQAAYGPLRPQADGRLLVARRFSSSGLAYPADLLRFGEAGQLDLTFGTGGRLLLTGAAEDVQPLPGGGLLILSSTGACAGQVARYDDAGALDPIFGTGGIACAGALESASALRLDGSGRILVAGGQAGGTAALVRLSPDGALDTGFASGGTYQASSSWGWGTTHLAVAADGRLVLGSGPATLTWLDASGQPVRQVMAPPGATLLLNVVDALAFDAAGRLVVATSVKAPTYGLDFLLDFVYATALYRFD